MFCSSAQLSCVAFASGFCAPEITHKASSPVEQQLFSPRSGRNPPQYDVQLILQQRLHQYVAGVDLDAHGQPGVALFQGRDGAGQESRGQCRNGANRDAPQVAGFERDQFFAHAAELGEHHARVVDDGFPERGRAHAPGQTLEEFDAEQVFGFVQHLGRCRLSHADVIGGAAQRTEFLQRQHQPQLAQTQTTVDYIGIRNSGHGPHSQKRLRQA
jgi:hypothetical protein